MAFSAIAFGWYVERSSRERLHSDQIIALEQKFEIVLAGNARLMDASRTNNLLRYYIESEEEFKSTIDDSLALNLIRVWKKRDEIDEAFQYQKSSYTAEMLADDALKILNCDSAKAFVTKTRKLGSFEGSETFNPEILIQSARNTNHCLNLWSNLFEINATFLGDGETAG